MERAETAARSRVRTIDMGRLLRAIDHAQARGLEHERAVRGGDRARGIVVVGEGAHEHAHLSVETLEPS